MDPLSRPRCSSRAALRSAAGSCAICSDGRSKSNSRTPIREDLTEENGPRSGRTGSVLVRTDLVRARKDAVLRERTSSWVRIDCVRAENARWSVDDGREPAPPRIAPLVVENRPQRLIELLAVAEERSAQRAFLYGAEL